jgi:NAD-dependent SIR2 family protein deacetylase
LEAAGHVDLLATQNVDRLHQRAGHRQVVDLHGRIDRVKCLDCGETSSRGDLQRELEALNPAWRDEIAEVRPDGDAEVADEVVATMRVPDCGACGGVLMPDVVFFGGTVPRTRVGRISHAIERADALLVVGSSLRVFSGFRFCRQARAIGKPLAIINRGETRADELATLKIAADAGEILDQLASSAGIASASVL